MIRRSLPRLLAVFVAAVALTFTASVATASAAEPVADVDDFDFSSWDATYEVGMDGDGRATLHVVETRVAEFPESDQNRGIVAGFPQSYQGAALETTIVSVRDGNGGDIPYEIEEDDGIVYVLTGDDEYVHGSTTYVIEYEMRDVILAAERTKVDEFYWDLLPLDSTQDINAFQAEVIFDDALSAHFTGATACYQGPQGSTDRCDLAQDGGTFTVSATDLPAGDGVSVAIALEQGTVTQPSARGPNAATDVLPYAVGGGSALLSVGGWFAVAAMIRSRRKATGIVVAQYDVPDSMPPILASAIVPRTKNSLAAQIVHLAVRGLLRIEDLPDDEKERRPRLRRLDGAFPDPLDERALKALFDSTEPGIVLKMPKNDAAFAKRMTGLLKAAPKVAEERGLTTKARSRGAQIIQIASIVALAAMIGLLCWGLFTGREAALPVLVATIFCTALVIISSVVAFSKHTVLTTEGALQLEYLEGVREFIRVAEADRLRMLQSYSGAERRSDGTVDVIHLYEKLLPYAILFRQEREWGKVLEDTYDDEQRSPGWIDGSSAGLVIRVNAFSDVTRASAMYSAPSTGSSSSFGGSSGGGFSGGGGGGGFSGGR